MALSHREKARKLQQESAAAWSAGKIDNDRYETLTRFYAEHLRLAQKDLAYWREEAAARADALKVEYRELSRDAQRLAQEEKEKRIAPAQAAQERTRIERETARRRAVISELAEVLTAEDSAALGGFIDLPLERYRGQQGAPSLDARRGWRLTWEMVVLALAGLLIAFAVITALPLFTGSDWSPWGARAPNIECAFAFDDAQQQSLIVECRNRGWRPFQMYLPWPDAVPSPDLLRDRNVGGIEVLVREWGEEEFQPRYIPSEWWFFNGRPLIAGEAVVVEPLLTVRFELDTAMVRGIASGAEAIRLEVKRGDGTLFDTFEADFSDEQPRPTPARIPPPERRPAPPATVPTEEVIPEIPEEEPVIDDEPEVPVEEVPAEPPVFAYVSVVGSVGGRAALAVQLPGETRARRVTVEAGDELGGGWMIDDVAREVEQTVVLVHPATGRRVQVRQGAPEPVRLTEPVN